MSTDQWKIDNQDLMRKYRREWYQRNKQRGITAVAKRKDEMRAWLRGYKRSCSCKICGETHPACLTFHHRDASEKLIEVSITIQYGFSKERVLAEIAKCDVMCANCHAKLHWAQLYEIENDTGGDLNFLANETNVLG